MNDKLNIQDLINPKNNEEESQKSTDDIIKLIAVQNLLSKDNLKTNTRVKMTQVDKLSKMYMFGKIFNIGFIDDLADHILELQISVNGLGRKELVELVGKVYNPYEGVAAEESTKKRGVFR